jgi:hypothetical protein
VINTVKKLLHYAQPYHSIIKKTNKRASRKDNMTRVFIHKHLDEGLIDFNNDDVKRSLKNHYKKKYYIATVTNCNEKGENIVVKKSEPFDREIYSNTSLSKCFNWIVSNFEKIGNDGDYDIMLKKQASEQKG